MHFDFIETFKRWVRRFFVVVGVFTTLFFALLFYFFYSSIKHIIPSTPSLPGQKEVVTLHLTLKGEITEKNNHFKMWGKLWSHNYENWNDVYLPEIKNALDKAAEDSKVNGLFLDLENLTGNLAQFTELRTILANFKKSGKPIHVWSAQFDYQTLYLASLADHISLAPYGDFMLMGPTFQLGYYHDTLKKLGIEFEVIRVGKYKSAAEPFLLSTPSAETLEMYQSLEKNLRDHVFKTIAEARKMPVAKVTQFFKQSIFTPREALASGLIDKLSYLDKSRDVIKDLVRGVPQDFYVYNMFLDSVGADFFESPTTALDGRVYATTGKEDYLANELRTFLPYGECSVQKIK